MKRHLKTLTPAFMLCAAGFATLPVSAVTLFCTNCATNIQAASSYAKEVESVVNQVTSLQNEVESIGYQLQNLEKLGSTEWGDAINQINRLGDIARQGDALAFSLADINDEWQRRFQGYEGWSSTTITPDQVSEQYRLWGDTMRDTAKSALQVAGEMAKVQQEDEQTLTTLQQHSASATGALQVAQAGNELTAQTTRQMQKIQTLLQTDIQMSAATLATASEKEAQQKAADDAFAGKPETNTDNGVDWSKPWNETSTDWKGSKP